jgi:putative transposase
MREPFHQLYYHLIWATWDRLPLLQGERGEAVYRCIQVECSELKVDVIAIGGVADHIHLLVRTPATVIIPNLAKQIKGSSSRLATHLDANRFFKWQGGYMAYTVSKSDVPRLREYIFNQVQHHANKTFDPLWEGEDEDN